MAKLHSPRKQDNTNLRSTWLLVCKPESMLTTTPSRRPTFFILLLSLIALGGPAYCHRRITTHDLLRVRLPGDLLGQQHGVDVGENASLGDGDSLEQLVKLFVVADS